MYAIVRQCGKQYRVSEGDEVVCDRVKGNIGDKVGFDKLLLVSDEDKTIVAPDELAKYRIEAELIENFLDDKILVFKYKAKKGYRRTTGHRQFKSRLKVVSIGAGKPATKKAVKEDEPVKKATAKKSITTVKPAEGAEEKKKAPTANTGKADGLKAAKKKTGTES